MEIEKPIPSKLIIKGQSAVITYKGQERTCFTCGSSSHENCTWPARIARYNPINNRSQPSTNVPAAQPAALNPTSRTDSEMHGKASSRTPVITTKSTGYTNTTIVLAPLIPLIPRGPRAPPISPLPLITLWTLPKKSLPQKRPLPPVSTTPLDP